MSLGSSIAEEEHIVPLQSFICSLKIDAMSDPVSLCTGTTCERKEIEKWFDAGTNIDQGMHELLSDFTLRPNFPLE